MRKIITAEEVRKMRVEAHLSWRESLINEELAKIELAIKENLKYNVIEIMYKVESRLVINDVKTELENLGYKVTCDSHSNIIYISWGE